MVAKCNPKIYDHCLSPSYLDHMAAKCDPKICAWSHQDKKKMFDFEILYVDLTKQASASNPTKISAMNVCPSYDQLQACRTVDRCHDEDEYPKPNKFEENKSWKIHEIMRKAEDAGDGKAPSVNKT